MARCPTGIPLFGSKKCFLSCVVLIIDVVVLNCGAAEVLRVEDISGGNANGIANESILVSDGACCDVESVCACCAVESVCASCDVENTGAWCDVERTGACCTSERTGACCTSERTGTYCDAEACNGDDQTGEATELVFVCTLGLG